MSVSRFNIRVYGLLLNDRNEVLVSDEYRFGNHFTKFPGGGLEFGEGISEGLKREFMEEMNLEIEVNDLFYVNDFLQISKFDNTSQLISFYYFVSPQSADNIPLTQNQLPLTEDGESQRWIAIEALSEEIMTFPVDQIVVEKLRNTPR